MNIIYFVRSHAFTLSSVKDIALRSASSSAFSAIISYTSKIFENDDPIKLEILRKHFIPLIGGGIRSTDDAVRNEFIIAFDILVTSFADTEPKLLAPFQQLQNVDKDLDFFANLTHIQHHRRQRAFKRFANALDDKSVSCVFVRGVTIGVVPTRESENQFDSRIKSSAKVDELESTPRSRLRLSENANFEQKLLFSWGKHSEISSNCPPPFFRSY